MQKPDKKDIKGYECRFAVHCESHRDNSDMHFIKEIIHTHDGQQIPNTRFVRNYKRPFYVTKKAYRDHQQQKEWEELEKVNKFECTQRDLQWSIAKAVGDPGYRGNMRTLLRNPYIYGADILSTALIKDHYQKSYPDLITPYRMAAFDTEKDMVKGTDEINIATISFGSRIYTAVVKSFFEGHSNVIERLQKALVKYLGEYVTKREIVWEVELVDSDIDIIRNCMNKGHEWQPDFMAIWNMNFDVPLMTSSLEKKRVSLTDIFNDPSVPEEYRYFKYKQGPNKKVTDSGKVMPLKPAEQWHTVYSPASFYFIDAMCVFQRLRIADGAEPSYALDAILDKVLGIRKLKFEEASHLEKSDWHKFMQEKYPFEYVIYNVFDCISMEELDEKTQDLRYSMPLGSGCSDFANFKSQPRRLVDQLHFTSLEDNYVIGCTSDQMSDEIDEKTLGLSDWIN